MKVTTVHPAIASILIILFNRTSMVSNPRNAKRVGDWLNHLVRNYFIFDFSGWTPRSLHSPISINIYPGVPELKCF
jgi:hypothetical protein